MCGYDFNDKLSLKYYRYKMDLRYIPFSPNKKYVSENIGEKDIYGWTSDCPVFISAQTGRGKNFFLKDVLVRMVHNNNIRNGIKRKILILSNRIALTRQSKKDWNLSLLDITGDNNEEKFELYTDKGIDKLLSDLGTVTVCSYQQLLGQVNYLKKQYFAYVIADECHFFTGDAMFNPFTHRILETLVKNFKRSVRVYMSATLEESFVPIIKAEYPHDLDEYDSEQPLFVYYYFERNFDYVKEIHTYDELNQLIEKISNNSKERWLVFVSSKSVGQKFSEICSSKGISNVFLTRESKDSYGNSEEHAVYRQILEEEKFSVQVLIATSVLDNGVNLKDQSIKHVVIDMLDQTEFVQMLGRVRILENAGVNLYVRQYSDNDIEKFFIDDVKKLIGRLKTTSVSKNSRPKYFYDLLGNQTEVQHMFYLTGDEKCFDYNPCAVYKLVSRIGIFLRILKSKSEYFINPEKLGSFRDDRTDLYTKYLNNANFYCPYREFLREPICQILELVDENKIREDKLVEYNRNGNKIFETPESFMDFSDAIELTFTAYLFDKLIKEQMYEYQSNYFDDYENCCSRSESDVDLDCYSRLERLKANISLLSLVESEVPALTEQSHWVGMNKLTSSEFVFVEPPAPVLSDSEVDEMLELLSITYEDYMTFSDNEKIKNSGGKEYVSFKNKSILEEKGCKKSLVKISDKRFPDKFDDSIVDKYNKIFDWVRRVKGITLKKLEELPRIVFDDGITFELKIVRGTQIGYQNEYCIFVRSIR